MRERTRTFPIQLGHLRKIAEKNKYVLIVLLVGIAVILWPGGGEQREGATIPEEAEQPQLFSLQEKETRMAYALSHIEGAGDVIVVLSLHTSVEQELAVDEDSAGRRETVIIGAGAGVQSEVTLRYHYPEFRGALVVSEGADNATVRLQITQAVASLTGLGTDRITVTRMDRGSTNNHE